MVIKELLDKFLEKTLTGKRDVGHFVNTGTSGTEKAAGYLSEEYLVDLRGEKAAETYDKMRRNDAQIEMLISTVYNPILSANWYVESASTEQADIEIKDFIEFCLFKDIGENGCNKQFMDFVEEALSMVPFGFSAFEVIHKVVNNHPVWGSYVGLRDLAYRSQKTIEVWNTDRAGRLISVEQQATSGDNNFVGTIPAEYLLLFTVRKEGENFEGISKLRPLYGNWFRKQVYLKLMGIGIERGMTNILVGSYPDQIGTQDNRIAQWEQVLEKFTSHERQFITKPDSFTLENFKLDVDVGKIGDAINRENTEMAKAFLASFMEMGISGTGSFALGSDLSDMFLAGIQYYARKITDGINSKIIPPLVRSKFGAQVEYPKLKVSGINDKAGKELAEILSLLNGTGLLSKDARMKEFVHKQYHLPDIIEDEVAADEPASDNMPAIQSEFQEGSKVQSLIFNKDIFKNKQAVTKWIKSHKEFNIKKGIDETDVSFRVRQEAPGKFKDMRTIEIDKGISAVIGFSEKKRGEAALAQSTEKTIDQKSEELRLLMQMAMSDRSAKFISSIEKILREHPNSLSRSRTQVMELGIPGRGDYEKMLKEFLSGLSEKEQRLLLKEMGIDLPNSKMPKVTNTRLNAEVALTVDTQDSDLRKNILFDYNLKVDTATSIDQMVKDMNAAATRYVEGASLAVGAVNFVSRSVNNSRNDIIQLPEVFDEVESFVYTNDDPVSDICQNLVGRVFSKEEYLTNADKLPPNHHNCKSYLVVQRVGDKGNKPISPLGLQYTGTEKQVEGIINSKTF